MKFKKGDLVITNPIKDKIYIKEVKHKSHFIGKVEKVSDYIVIGKIFHSDFTDFIGKEFGMSKDDLLTINEAVKLGVMYED